MKRQNAYRDDARGSTFAALARSLGEAFLDNAQIADGRPIDRHTGFAMGLSFMAAVAKVDPTLVDRVVDAIYNPKIFDEVAEDHRSLMEQLFVFLETDLAHGVEKGEPEYGIQPYGLMSDVPKGVN